MENEMGLYIGGEISDERRKEVERKIKETIWKRRGCTPLVITEQEFNKQFMCNPTGTK